MRISVAWNIIRHKKARAAASMAGVCIAMLLVYMQLGFYSSCFTASTMVYDQLDFDLILVSPHYYHLRFADRIPRRRLFQADQIPAVRETIPIYIATGRYRQLLRYTRHEVLVLGVDPATRPFISSELNDKLRRLKKRNTGIVDAVTTGQGQDHFSEGTHCEVQNRRIEIVGRWQHGPGFICDTEMIVSDATLFDVLPETTPSRVSLGLVRLDNDADVRSVQTELMSALPDDTVVWRRDQIDTADQNSIARERPLGIQFGAGVLLGISVWAIVLYQVLATEVIRNAREFVMLRAIGYKRGDINWIIIQLATMYVVAGCIPASVLAVVLYHAVTSVTKLPIQMTVQRLIVVLCFSVVLACVAALLSARRVHRMDPADLY